MQDVLVEKAINIIKEATFSIKDIANKGNFAVFDKGQNDPLTEADLKADKILNGLSKLINNSVYYSEEREDNSDRFKKDYVWVVDPIDGTREFVKGISEYAISVALIKRGEIIFSAVSNPFDSIFISLGDQLFLEKLGDFNPEDKAAFCISRTLTNDPIYDHLKDELPLVAIGSIAYKLALVAFKRFKGVISIDPKNEWDIAGGMGLINASSGLIGCDIYGLMPRWHQKTKIQGLLAGKRQTIRELIKQKPIIDWYQRKGF